jgi:hypothetical protein
MNNNELKLSELLEQLMQEKGVTVEKLTYATNIPHRFVTALIDGDFKGLPAKPYVRGYLLKIATALSVEPAIILKAYKESLEIKGSGEKDKLPVNRFAIQRISKNLVIVLLILILLAGFLAWRMKDILGTPTVKINLPEDTLVVRNESIRITGEISSRDRLTLNQEIVYTDDAGKFEREITLLPGLNTLEFNVKRFLGREIRITRQILYEAPINLEPPINESQVTEEN